MNQLPSPRWMDHWIAARSHYLGLVSVSRDILQAGPFEQEAKRIFSSTRARLPGRTIAEIGYVTSTISAKSLNLLPRFHHVTRVHRWEDGEY
jgi:hypothetical protein